LNTYAYLYRKAGFTVNNLQIVAILRDWMASKAAMDPNYPQVQVSTVEVPLWTLEEQEKFLTDKVQQFLRYENIDDDTLPDCNNEELWYTGDKWAVKKKGLKRAMNGGTFTDEDKAKTFAEAQKVDTEIEFRKGEAKRCAYCDVREFCNQYKGDGK